MNTEFQRYRFADSLKATALAPLASIPAVLLVALLIVARSFFSPTDITVSPSVWSAMFRGWASILIAISLPSAYLSTATFGTLGFLIGNARSIRLTSRIGAIAGVVCGVFTGLFWTLLLASLVLLGSGDSDLASQFGSLGRVGLIILPVAILSGLFVGVVYSQLLNRFVQNRSTS